ncbi:hypothetical protein SANTM175S_01564 [Streptomyces antimycoticus]
MRSLHGPPFCVRTFLELSHATMAPTDAGWAFSSRPRLVFELEDSVKHLHDFARLILCRPRAQTRDAVDEW